MSHIGRRLAGSHRKDYVTWSNSYSMGIKEIDDQHKGLLGFVNDLHNHATGNEKEEREYFKEVIQQAVEYVKTHFATEENYMVAAKFPGYTEHKREHDLFVRTIVKTVNDYQAGKRLTLTYLARFLKDWILSHVAVEDVQYARYFRSIATRKADGKLSITNADIKLL